MAANYYWLRTVNASGIEAAGVPLSIIPMELVFSASSFPEDTTVGSVVAALSVVGLPGGVTVSSYTITADPDSKFQIDGSNLELAAGVNYEAATTHSVTVEATMSNAATVSGTQVFTVTNVFEAASLNALTLDTPTIEEATAAGVLVGTLQSTTGGSTLSLIDDAGGRFALDAGTIETGATATDYSAATSHNITVRETLADSTNSPRDSVIAIAVTAAAFDPINLSPTAWYDPSDLATLFQDAAMTTPVTTDGDVVGAMMDKSGNGLHLTQATTASKPLYKTAGGLHWIQYDGVNDYLGKTFAAATFGTDVDMTAGAQKNGANVAWIVGGGATTASPALATAQNGSALTPTSGTSGSPVYRVDGTQLSANSRDVLHDVWLNTTSRVIEADGADLSSWTAIGIASDHSTHNDLTRLYGLLIAPALSAGNATSLREWMAAKAGITL